MTTPSEKRLEELRDQAWKDGVVAGRGIDIAGGPIPHKLATASPSGGRPGYYGQPVVKPPVWTWEIPVYFFVGGLAGMSAVIALAAAVFDHVDVARAAMWLAAIGAVLSPILLILDLGRPHLFINMLRVFKPQSPMSMGAWILTAFGACVVPGLIAIELHALHTFTGAMDQFLRVGAGLLIFASAHLRNVARHLYRRADRRDSDTGVVSASRAAADTFRRGWVGICGGVTRTARSSNRATQRDRIFCSRRRISALGLADPGQTRRRRSRDTRTQFGLAYSHRRNL